MHFALGDDMPEGVYAGMDSDTDVSDNTATNEPATAAPTVYVPPATEATTTEYIEPVTEETTTEEAFYAPEEFVTTTEAEGDVPAMQPEPATPATTTEEEEYVYTTPPPSTPAPVTTTAIVTGALSMDVDHVNQLLNSVAGQQIIKEAIAKKLGVPASEITLTGSTSTRRLSSTSFTARRLTAGTVVVNFKATTHGGGHVTPTNVNDMNHWTGFGLKGALAAAGIHVSDACTNGGGECSPVKPASILPNQVHHLLTGTMMLTVTSVQNFINARTAPLLQAAIAAGYGIPQLYVEISKVTPLAPTVGGRRLTAGSVNVEYNIRDPTMAVNECAAVPNSAVITTATNAGLAHVGLQSSVTAANVPCSAKSLVNGATTTPLVPPPPVVAKFAEQVIEEAKSVGVISNSAWIAGGMLGAMVVLSVVRGIRAKTMSARTTRTLSQDAAQESEEESAGDFL